VSLVARKLAKSQEWRKVSLTFLSRRRCRALRLVRTVSPGSAAGRSTQPDSNCFKSEDPPTRSNHPSHFWPCHAMASPPPAQSTMAAPTSSVASPPSAAASKLHAHTYLATSSPRANASISAPGPPLFTGRPPNPNPPGHAASVAHNNLSPVATSAGSVHQRRIPPMAVGYPHADAVTAPIAKPPQPMMLLRPGSYTVTPQALVKGVAVHLEQSPRRVPIAPQPKVSEF
jgi:hypothetical protein